MEGHSKVNKVVFQEREKQDRLREKNTEDGVAYVDSARNIAVVLEAKDLSEDLESENLGCRYDPTAPNTKVHLWVGFHHSNEAASDVP